MAFYNTIQDYVGTGSTSIFPIGFPILVEADIVAYIDSVVSTDYEYNSVTNQLTFNTAPTAGTAIVIKREVDRSQIAHVFSDKTILRNSNLDGNFTQVLYSMQEDADLLLRRITFTGDVEDVFLEIFAAVTAAENAADESEIWAAQAALSAASAAADAVATAADVAFIGGLLGGAGAVLSVDAKTGVVDLSGDYLAIGAEAADSAALGAETAVQWQAKIDDATIPLGGATGQVLAKLSGGDLDVDWVNQSGGGGALPTSTDGGVLVGVAADGGFIEASYITMSETTTPGQVELVLSGTIAIENSTTPGDYARLSVTDFLGGANTLNLELIGSAGGLIIAETIVGAGNEVSIFAGFVAVTKDPTDALHLATKQYVDNTADLPTGVAENMLRHNGVDWEVATDLTVSSAGDVQAKSLIVTGDIAGGSLSTNGRLLEAKAFGIIGMSDVKAPIFGSITSAGGILGGSGGFTCSKLGTGQYRLTFTDAATSTESQSVQCTPSLQISIYSVAVAGISKNLTTTIVDVGFVADGVTGTGFDTPFTFTRTYN